MTPFACSWRATAPGTLIAAVCFTLVLLTGCTASRFIEAQATTRETLHLSLKEREHLRAGMRAFLESVEGITSGLAGNERAEVERSARRSGWSMMDETAVAAALKLPPGFVAVAIDTHQKFDDLAAAAKSGAPKSDMLERLADILANCTSCHATYRLAPQ